MSTVSMRTKDTEERYLDTAKQILVRYFRHTGMEWEDDPDKFLVWLDEVVRRNVAKRSWWYYRAALAFYFDRRNLSSMVDALKKMSASKCLKKSLRCGGGKKKHIPEDELDALCTALMSKRGRGAHIAATWLMAGVITGLRPCEWWRSRLDGDCLIVENAKATNGRGSGKYRKLKLTDPDAMAIVRDMLAIASCHEYERLYETCRLHIYDTSRKLWPGRKRYPTLYSGRHQFAADAKSRGLSKRAVADFMGHASEETATTHYGKRRFGRGMLSVDLADHERESERFVQNE